MSVDLLESAKSGPRRSGRKWLIAHLEGHKITRNQAIQGKCYDCDGMGDSGECCIETCTLYPFSPFKMPMVGFSRARMAKKASNLEVA